MMRWAACGIALVALVASGWGQAEGASPGKRRITTEQEYRDEVVGKRMITEHGYVVPHEDGTKSGKVSRKEADQKVVVEGKVLFPNLQAGKQILRSRLPDSISGGRQADRPPQERKGKAVCRPDTATLT